MVPRKLFHLSTIFIAIISLFLGGCTIVFQKGRRADIEKISKLKKDLTELEQAKAELEDLLKGEINDKQVKVEMKDKGLVITFVAEVLFDSGKDELKQNALPTLQQVTKVLATTVSDLKIGIEGHTDNQPIHFSKWKSNWELSTARSLSVLHYLVDTQNIEADRLAATGYGEYRPVASNDDKDGRQKNRRVEIVIIPDVAKEKNPDLLAE